MRCARQSACAAPARAPDQPRCRTYGFVCRREDVHPLWLRETSQRFQSFGSQPRRAAFLLPGMSRRSLSGQSNPSHPERQADKPRSTPQDPRLPSRRAVRRLHRLRNPRHQSARVRPCPRDEARRDQHALSSGKVTRDHPGGGREMRGEMSQLPRDRDRHSSWVHVVRRVRQRVPPERFELPTRRVETVCSIP